MSDNNNDATESFINECGYKENITEYNSTYRKYSSERLMNLFSIVDDCYVNMGYKDYVE